MNKIIKFNVGGKKYMTTTDTLNKAPESLLVIWANEYSNNIINVDRDGPSFRYILNYLRDLSKWTPPNDVDILSQLILEANYYGLDKLKARLEELRNNLIEEKK